MWNEWKVVVLEKLTPIWWEFPITEKSERKAGEMLRELERGKTGPKKLHTIVVDNSDYRELRTQGGGG